MARTGSLALILALQIFLPDGNNACPDINVTENVVIVSNTSNVIQFDCERGFNLTNGDTEITCVNGLWHGELPTCSVIECPDLNFANKNNYNNYSGVNTYDTVIDIVCFSGYQFQGNSYSSMSCTYNGTWDPIPTGKRAIDCTRKFGYIGCLSSGLTDPVNFSPQSDLLTCRESCKLVTSRYLALSNSSCWCSNSTNNPMTLTNNSDCNDLCTGNPEDGFCGGTNGELSLYFVWGGCYDNIKVEDLTVVHVDGDKQETCKQYCLGYGAFYGILNMVDSTCTCTDYINTDATFPTDNTVIPCNSEQYVNGTSSFVYNILDESTPYTSCEDLYKAGIRVNGNYSLKNQPGLTNCIFKDGTRCDEKWVGYNGICYLFSDLGLNFEQSRNHCASYNANLVSILDTQENSFIQEYLSIFPKEKKMKWFLGLYSTLSDGSFLWTDGQMFQFTAFESKEPSVLAADNGCAVWKTETNKWYAESCINLAGTICKKSANYRCVHGHANLDLVNSSIINGDVTLTACIQVCKGQNKTFSAIKGEECKCTNDVLPSESDVYLIDCNIPCKDDNGQRCGGNSTYSVISVESYKGAESCEELEVFGISGNTFYIEVNSSVQYCPQTGCPRSWIEGNSSCYRFIRGVIPFSSVPKYCSAQDSYVVSLEDDTEKDFIVSIVQSTEQYNGVLDWAIGLYSDAGTMTSKWFSSKQSIDAQDQHALLTNNAFCRFNRQGMLNWQHNLNAEHSFICEKNNGYLGCYEVQLNETSIITSSLDVYDYSDMVQCIEWCRTSGDSYALSGASYKCACSNKLPSKVDGKLCDHFCNIGQPCGGSKQFVSVYRIDKYPTYDTCDELFKAGVSLSHYYILSTGTEYCMFYDNVTNCPPKWVGLNGSCYLGVYGKEQSLSWFRDQCRIEGGIIGTIRDTIQHDVLKEYFTASTLLSKNQFSLLGLVNAFLTGSVAWASGDISQYLPFANFEDKTLTNFYTFDTELISTFIAKDFSTSHNAICEIPEDHKGCYNISIYHELKPLALHWMELTFCKQLCIGNGSAYAGIQENACYCFNDTDLEKVTKLSSSYCDSICPGNFFQYCGTKDSLNVFSLSSAPLAKSCDQLHNFGIFFKANYQLELSNGTKQTACGFSDSTTCNPGWYGYDGSCYKFIVQPATFLNASQDCFKISGFLVAPNASNIEFLTSMLNVSLFSFSDYWWTGLNDMFGISTFLSSNGRQIYVTPNISSPSSHSVEQLILFQSSGAMERSENTSLLLPYICQKESEYIGCIGISTLDANITGSLITHSGMSSTFCMQYCYGQNADLAGVMSSTSCQCYTHVKNYSMSSSPCFGCPGYPTQACGSNDAISLYKTNLQIEDLLPSCDDLMSIGITEPAWYYIKPLNLAEQIKVQCFVKEASFMNLRVTSTVTASSSKINHEPTKAEIKWPLDSADSWKPAVNDYDQFIRYTFSEDVVLTGITMQGNPLDKNNEWITSFTLHYQDEVLNSFQTYSSDGKMVNFTGNADKSSFKFIFLHNPVITKTLEIRPQAWHNWPTARIQLLGQSFSLYNFSVSVVGCYHITPDVIQQATKVDSGNQTECRSTCLKMQFPFYSFTAEDSLVWIEDECYCWNDLPSTYGTFDDENCTAYDRMFVYKSYEKQCPFPLLLPYSNQNVSFIREGIYSFKSTVTYDCDEGFILPNLLHSKPLRCGQDNTWLGSNDTCQAVKCPELVLPINSTADTNSTGYGTIVNITCDLGYTLNYNGRSQYLQCTNDNVWNATVEECKAINCGEPPYIPLAERIGDIFTYNNTVNYTCPKHMSFTTGESSILSRCLGDWKPLPSNCSYFECPDPVNLLDGSYVRSSSNTVYTCKPLYAFSDGSQTKTIACSANFTWEDLNDVCSRQDDQTCYRASTSTVYKERQRQITNQHDVLSEFVPRSQMACAGACLSDWRCQGYNYKMDQCVLFVNKAMPTYIQTANDWIYFEKDDENLYPC